VQSSLLAEGSKESTPIADDEEILQASIKAGSVAQVVVAVIAVIGLVYLLKLVLVTTLSSVLLALCFSGHGFGERWV
jgi:hypothetical protein